MLRLMASFIHCIFVQGRCCAGGVVEEGGRKDHAGRMKQCKTGDTLILHVGPVNWFGDVRNRFELL